MLSNLSEQEKTAKEIKDTKKVLAEALSKLSRLRRTQQALREQGAEVFYRRMQGLEESEEPDSPQPMSGEQVLTGQVQSIGAFGVVD